MTAENWELTLHASLASETGFLFLESRNQSLLITKTKQLKLVTAAQLA